MDWLLDPFGLGSPGYGLTATVITLAYLWLPYMILPVYAGLERLPELAARGLRRPRRPAWTTLRRVVLPLAFPAIVAGSIFTFSLTLGDYIAVQIVGGTNQMLGNVVLRQRRRGEQPAVRGGRGDRPGRRDAGLPRRCPSHRRAGEPVNLSRGLRSALVGFTSLVLLVVYVPLALVVLNSFNTSRTFAWPPTDLTLRWWSLAAGSQGARDALWVSVQVAVLATPVALVLGTMAALALQRTRFFGRNAVSLLIILPIALPGIVTGLALNNGFRSILELRLGFATIVVAHATFCIVIVFNNVQARLRRMGGNLEEASMDLGAGTFTTFRLVTFPMLRSALLAGGLLAFALSFDEIVVTTFTAGSKEQTLPIWIFNNLFRPNQAPVVNVVAAVLVVVSIVPIYVAQRLSGGVDHAGR